MPKRKRLPRETHPHSPCHMVSQEVDLVAFDFDGIAWRCRSRDNLSTIDEAFMDSTFLTPPSPTPLHGRGSILDNRADVCGFLKPPGSLRAWKMKKHGAFSNPRKALGLTPNVQRCHHETWLHLYFLLIEATRGPGRVRTSHAFLSKNDTQKPLMEISNVVSVKSSATIRSHLDMRDPSQMAFSS